MNELYEHAMRMLAQETDNPLDCLGGPSLRFKPPGYSAERTKKAKSAKRSATRKKNAQKKARAAKAASKKKGTKKKATKKKATKKKAKARPTR